MYYLDLLASVDSGTAMVDLFYSGVIAQSLVDDITDMGEFAKDNRYIISLFYNCLGCCNF